MIKEKPSDRIEILDGFRFIAILSVILYHYFSLWAPPIHATSLYPYEGKYSYFRLGSLGVQFFFIISGFVIASSLQASSSVVAFLKKRMIRLFPAMLICSLITFFICILLDSENIFDRSKEPVNLLYSLTFINSELLNFLLKPLNIHGRTLCGSYWSLWPEIQFYVAASVIYYLDPSKFFTRFLLIALLFNLINLAFTHNFFNFHSENQVLLNYIKFANIFNILNFILWFAAGIVFYQLHSKQANTYTWPGLVLIFLLILFDCSSIQAAAVVSLMFSLFFIFIYSPWSLKILKTAPVTSIGLASYSLYLIHENIGVLFIHKYAETFGELSGLFPLLLIVAFMLFSWYLFRFVERPLGIYLKSKLISKKV